MMAVILKTLARYNECQSSTKGCKKKNENIKTRDGWKGNSPAKNAGSPQPHCLDADSFLLVLRWDIGRKTPQFQNKLGGIFPNPRRDDLVHQRPNSSYCEEEYQTVAKLQPQPWETTAMKEIGGSEYLVPKPISLVGKIVRAGKRNIQSRDSCPENQH